MKKNEGKTVNQLYLFHGTDNSLVEAICEQNFDWRVCGVHGTVYGKGMAACGSWAIGILLQQGLVVTHPFVYSRELLCQRCLLLRSILQIKQQAEKDHVCCPGPGRGLYPGKEQLCQAPTQREQ